MSRVPKLSTRTVTLDVTSSETSSESSETSSESSETSDSYSFDESIVSLNFFTKFRKLIIIILVVIMLITIAFFLWGAAAGFFIYNFTWLSTKGLIGKAPDYWKVFFSKRMYVSFEVHPFSIANVDDVLKGKKPRMKEGPTISFRLISRKSNITYSIDKDDVTFDEKCDAQVTDKSRHNYEQTIHSIVNVPFWLTLLLGYDIYGTYADTQIFELLKNPSVAFEDNSPLTADFTLKSLLFGGHNLFCKSKIKICVKIRHMIEKTKSRTFVLKEDGIDFSLFAYLFGKFNVTATMHSGIRNTKMAGHLKKLNGQELITTWDNGSTTSTCNKIRGLFHFYPGSGNGLQDFELWISELCRPVMFRYKAEKSDDDFLQFEISDDTFFNNLDRHLCYCRNNPRNRYWYRSCFSGVMGLVDCLGSSLMVSFPHFINSAEQFTSKVEGLQPNLQKHTSRIIMYKKNGSFTELSIKYQINVPIFNVDRIPILAKVPWALVPIMWIEQKLLVTAQEMQDFIKVSPYSRAFHEEMVPVNIFRFTMIVVCLLILTVCIILLTLLILKTKPPLELKVKDFDEKDSI
ncbi:sensory neuron membrane protein 2-like [Anthonomus grandis grandis]|uniref:sensory neuron membrane protein 2-like n=1 Tax=Anthonomus grandis grandis TaxID=2921223 RepID=UPI002165E1BF|nr:sensory neuron membrane protein 2-like [Anthonomus grandis grandis]